MASETRLISTKEEAEALIVDLSRLRLGAIAIDTEYQFNTAPATLGNGGGWNDIRTLNPLILSSASCWTYDQKICGRRWSG